MQWSFRHVGGIPNFLFFSAKLRNFSYLHTHRTWTLLARCTFDLKKGITSIHTSQRWQATRAVGERSVKKGFRTVIFETAPPCSVRPTQKIRSPRNRKFETPGNLTPREICGVPVTFNLDPRKIGSLRNKFFSWNIWTHSEKFFPSHTTGNQWLLRTLVGFTVAYLDNEWLLFMSMPQRPHAAFETWVHRKLCTMFAESDSCVRPEIRLQYVACR